ncbi:saccharopine dehydrogenase NADP-binding domain-containing protein [Candidatus Symbiopectobacterium sp. NZEC127]|uniref:saccharopine dehydrogenase NADP-binding domain-containing protein n=2 Tax=unclassified Symbiopectobacterium TaxID=2794573 RepID=UPI002226884B|nr:saccharopine dehydrogenase NADP-binding domain-containing protein [Candidatus Symbiopectobacterium sp. NZEC127]MCW2485251.1 saccharopine dehydrogenase NADP-binding domain-containing protein [Candidatus Symbiopectobacterium sp. NZEC127]
MKRYCIAILGATGSIGREVTCWLGAAGYTLRLGARQPEALHALAQQVNAHAQVVDLYQQEALDAFSQGCALVVNCAGPSYLVLDRVARSAARAGAHYIDVSGDAPVWHLLQQTPTSARDWTAVLSAGMLPGLANLIPDWLGVLPDDAITVYSGGRESVRGAAAGDLVLSVNDQYGTVAAASYWYGESSAFWVKGEPHLRRLPTELRNDLAHFPGEVTLLPFLSSDAERLATRHQLRELRWYNVFSGSFLRETLTGLRGWVNNAERLTQAVAQVEQASELDLLGHSPYYRLVFDLLPHNKPRRRAVISTDSSAALTAAVTVSTVNALLRGDISPGVHFADDVLMATQTFNDVVRLHPGTQIRQYLPDERLEEGRL